MQHCESPPQQSLTLLLNLSRSYAGAACRPTFEVRNIFIPQLDEGSPHGQYHKVYVGAACPADRLPAILKVSALFRIAFVPFIDWGSEGQNHKEHDGVACPADRLPAILKVRP